MKSITLFFLGVLFLNACKPAESDNVITLNPATHTFSNIEKVQTTHLNWDAKINFDLKQISGTAIWHFKNLTKEKYIHFDTYDLTIKKIKVNGKETQYFLTPLVKDYGSGLSIPIKEKDSMVSIEYSTGALATALQWLTPEQTAGKLLPYLFTQCESIQARSLVPCQDVPAIRITYKADVQVPKGMLALMSAKNPIEKNPSGNYQFEMELPVPSYLIALAVGDIEYKAIDARSGVYTEPVLLEKAANELSDIPQMMQAAESICGPYRWGKYDVLVAPPSFPIGGMENPRLTFSTPTIIAGDKSLVSLIAHEMAHSWSGNLVTNSNWKDIWLNEGYTTYFERRIMEKVSGKSYNDMLWELGYQDMLSDFETFGINHADTKLCLDLNGRNPENAFSNIPYEKGAIFLKTLEENCGRTKFDKYLNEYFNSYAFQSMNTELALKFMDQKLFDGDTLFRNKLKVREWIYGPGLPDNFVPTNPSRFIAVDSLRISFEKTGIISSVELKNWTTHEWLHFLRKLVRPQSLSSMTYLDQNFNLSKSQNSEIAAEWFKLSIASNYAIAYPEMEKFLSKVGRKKFLEPLYGEMKKSKENSEMAQLIFAASKKNYHPLTAIKIGKLLNAK